MKSNDCKWFRIDKCRKRRCPDYKTCKLRDEDTNPGTVPGTNPEDYDESEF